MVCGGGVVRALTGRGESLAAHCTRCGTTRFAPAAGRIRPPAQSLDDYRANRRAVREHILANLAVIEDLTRGRRLLEVSCAGEIAFVLARAAGFRATRLQLPPFGSSRTGATDAGFFAPLEQEVLSDQIYDVVYARGGLGRAPDPRAFVTNLSLLLDRRGILFVSAPAVETANDGGIAVARRQRNAFTRGGLSELLENAGFTIVCESAGFRGSIAYTARLED